ncbi:MAG: HAD hydrolase-like protein [Lachnospiraceae bacterium]|nr:HAD hydrolase-like protein [Lachnospiraceae bacterium]
MNYYPNDEEALKKIIEKYEAISFDIWDTLIARTVLQPEDVFSIVENRAKQMEIEVLDFRMHRHEAVFQVVCANPNISEIYDALQKAANLSDSTKETLMQLEIQAESEVIVPRKAMVEVLNYAVLQGKRVNLISDMYLPGEVMESFLRQLGITGYENIFISCDYRRLKKEGLYSFYKEKVQAETYLHIGDNLDSDILAAEHWGMNAAFIKSGYRLLEESAFAEMLSQVKTHNERNMAGLFCVRVFNDPFIGNGQIKISDVEDLGWLFIAPIMSAFMLWLEKEVQKEHFDGLLFAARDGFLIQKLYRQMQKKRLHATLPKGIFFLTSRALCTQAGIEDEEDILWLATVKFNGTAQELLRYRFFLTPEEIMSSNGETENITEYIMRHKKEIFLRASENRRNYLLYMKNLGIEEGKKYIFFDFVSSGTCQYFLERFVPFEMKGKYFCRSVTEDKKGSLKIDSFYINNGVEKADSLLYKNYRYLETIMTSPNPSLCYIDEKLEPVYDEETRNEEELQFIEKVHKSIEEYFGYFQGMCDWNEEINVKIAEELYQYMDETYFEITCKTLDSMRLRDDWVREFAPNNQEK